MSRESQEALRAHDEDTPAAGAVDLGALPPVLTVDEVAALLRVNRKTVYEALARGEMPGARRVGRVIRIARDPVLRWLADDSQGRVSRSRRNG